MKKLAVLLVVLLLTLVAVIPVYAAPPVVETGNIDKEVPFLDCGDFDGCRPRTRHLALDLLL